MINLKNPMASIMGSALFLAVASNLIAAPARNLGDLGPIAPLSLPEITAGLPQPAGPSSPIPSNALPGTLPTAAHVERLLPAATLSEINEAVSMGNNDAAAGASRQVFDQTPAPDSSAGAGPILWNRMDWNAAPSMAEGRRIVNVHFNHGWPRSQIEQLKFTAHDRNESAAMRVALLPGVAHDLAVFEYGDPNDPRMPAKFFLGQYTDEFPKIRVLSGTVLEKDLKSWFMSRRADGSRVMYTRDELYALLGQRTPFTKNGLEEESWRARDYTFTPQGVILGQLDHPDHTDRVTYSRNIIVSSALIGRESVALLFYPAQQSIWQPSAYHKSHATLIVRDPFLREAVLDFLKRNPAE